jgi:toxin ParE1/3/4
MILPLELLPEAVADIREAREWYEEKRLNLGDEFVARLNECLDQIEGRPLTFPVVRKSIRRAVLDRFPYCVHFVVREDMIVVIAVLHGSRHPNLLLTRLIH